jgi:hypothetical protein
MRESYGRSAREASGRAQGAATFADLIGGMVGAQLTIGVAGDVRVAPASGSASAVLASAFPSAALLPR